MLRKIIKIDKEKCNGCGACVSACHEGAIGIEQGKARLVREDFCDGLGDCLPVCPKDAISFEFKEVSAKKVNGSCPSVKARTVREKSAVENKITHSHLMQWPCQLKLAPPSAPYFENADLLIAADCTAYAYAALHNDFMNGRITLIGCPKLDNTDYSQKLLEILAVNNVKSILTLRMEVPCCRGIEQAVQNAVAACGKNIPTSTLILTTDGKILD